MPLARDIFFFFFFFGGGGGLKVHSEMVLFSFAPEYLFW